MSLYYLSTIDMYLGKRGIFSPQEVIEADRLEKIWQDSQNNYSLSQLLEIFPEAKIYVSRKLKNSVKILNTEIADLEESKVGYHNSRFSAPTDQKWIFAHIIEGVDEKIKLLTTQLKREMFIISSLKGTKEVKAGKITEADVARAKTIPVESVYYGHLHKTGSTLVGKCPLHTERTGSFTIYTKTNRWWCFGESIGGDVIDLVAKQRNITFLEAVKVLLNK